MSNQARTHCRICGREFAPGEQVDPNGEQCYDLNACATRKREQEQERYRQRSTQWANQGQRRFNQYCQSSLGAQAYVIRSMANGATTIRPDKAKAAYSETGPHF